MTAASTRCFHSIESLAELARSPLPLSRNAVHVTTDGVLGIAHAPAPSRLRFNIDHLQFHVSVSPEGNGSMCQIWAEVGHVPYTAQSPTKRRDVLTILRGTRNLERAHFVLEDGQKILVLSESHVDGPVTPDVLVYETVMLLQEARPFLRLFAEHL